MRRVLFLGLSGLLTGLFVLAYWIDSSKDWTRYQRQFRRSLAPEERRGVGWGIQQVLVNDLRRVDRCTTCHVAIDKPQLALGEEPFTAHPGKFLEWHPIDKFGCTVCHGGQGLATQTADAHGQVPHWDEPLLRGDFIQASCWQCHRNRQDLASFTPKLVRGEALFRAKGCSGCHAVRDVGQTVSQDLTEVGSKPPLLIEADFEMMEPPHDRIHWFLRKLRNPRALNPGVRPEELPIGEEEVFPSAMPRFAFSEADVQALTTYLLSLTALDPPASYIVPETRPEAPGMYASPVELGHAVFERLGCAGCHGEHGVGGRRNWNAGLGQEIPPLLYVKAYYGTDVEALKELIRGGRQPAPRQDPSRPRPSLYMPPWKDRLTDEELDALVAYLFSLADRLPQAGAAQAQVNAGGAAQTIVQ